MTSKQWKKWSLGAGLLLLWAQATSVFAVPTLQFDGVLDYQAGSGILDVNATLTGYTDLSVSPVLAGSTFSLAAVFDQVVVTPLGFGLQNIQGQFLATGGTDLVVTGGDGADLLRASVLSLGLTGLGGTSVGSLTGQLSPIAGGLLFDDFSDPTALIALVINLSTPFDATMYDSDFSAQVDTGGPGSGLISTGIAEPSALLLALPGLLLLVAAKSRVARTPPGLSPGSAQPISQEVSIMRYFSSIDYANPIVLLAGFLLLLMVGMGAARASVVLPPHADFGSLPQDFGAVQGLSGGLKIDASLINFIDAADQPVLLDIPVDFRLLAEPRTVLVPNTVWRYGSGLLCIGDSCGADPLAGELLSATFDQLLLINQHNGTYTLGGDLLYTGGSLVTAGEQGAIVSLLSQMIGHPGIAFVSEITGRVGPVSLSAVPLPAAVWLMLGGLGLVFGARGRTAGQQRGAIPTTGLARMRFV